MKRNVLENTVAHCTHVGQLKQGTTALHCVRNTGEIEIGSHQRRRQRCAGFSPLRHYGLRQHFRILQDPHGAFVPAEVHQRRGDLSLSTRNTPSRVRPVTWTVCGCSTRMYQSRVTRTALSAALIRSASVWFWPSSTRLPGDAVGFL